MVSAIHLLAWLLIFNNLSFASTEVATDQGQSEAISKPHSIANGFLPSPYKQCQNYKLLAESDFKKDQQNWQEQIAKDPTILIIKDPGVLGDRFEQDNESMEFLVRLAESSLREITHNTELQRQSLICYKQWSEANGNNKEKSISSDCTQLITKEMQKHKVALAEARMELALSEGKNLTTISNGQRLGFELAPAKEMINPSLKDLSWLDSTVRAPDLQPLNNSESEQVKEQFIRESYDLRKSIAAHEYHGVEAKLKELRNRHKLKYLSLIQQDPLLLTLGTSEDGTQNARAKIYEAKKKLIDLALKTQGILKDTLLHPKPKTKLLANLVFTPMVEDLLKILKEKNPNFCATASSLYYSLNKVESLNRFKEVGGLALGEFGASTALGFLVPPIELGVGALTLPAALIAMVAMGPSLYYLKASSDQVETAAGALVGKIGTGEEVNSKSLEQKSNIASIPLDLATIGVGSAAGKLIRSNKKQSELLKESLGIDEKNTLKEILKLDHKDSLRKHLDSLSPNDNLTQSRKILKTWNQIPGAIKSDSVGKAWAIFGMGQKLNTEEIVLLYSHWNKSAKGGVALRNFREVLQNAAAISSEGLPGISGSQFRQAVRNRLEASGQIKNLIKADQEILLDKYALCGKRVGIK